MLTTPVRSEPLATQVYDILKEAIFSGQLQPGEVLSELNVARKLEVSQATVREALVRLEQSGLVLRSRNRRTSVSNFTAEEVRDRLSMRIVLEQLAAVKAAERMTDADFAVAESHAADIVRAVASGSYTEATLADVRFHHFIWKKCDSEVIYRTLDHLTTPLFVFIGVLHASVMADLRATKPHERIVAALRSRDPECINFEIRWHIEDSYRTFLESGAPSLDALVGSTRADAVAVSR